MLNFFLSFSSLSSFVCRFRVMTKKGQKEKIVEKELVEKDTKASADADDEEVNSGFGSYLRSSAGKKPFIEISMRKNNCAIFLCQDKKR